MTSCSGVLTASRIVPPIEGERAGVWTGRGLIAILGATSLAGQVCWSRLTSVSVGGTLAPAAITLSGAMAGLALGSLLAAVLLKRFAPRGLLIGTVFSGAAMLAAVPWLMLQIGAVEGRPLLRLALAASLLVAAHVPFGAALPAAVAWRGYTHDRLRSGAGALYAWSALGSMIGALGVGEILAAHFAFDVIGVLLAGASAACALPIALSRRGTAAVTRATPVQAPTSAKMLAVAFSLGLLGLAVETLWLQVLGFYWESNTLCFGLVTSSYVGGLSLGSLVASRRASRGSSVSFTLALSAVSLAGAASLAPLAVHAFTTAERALTAFALVGIPASLFGATFVLLLGGASGAGSGARTMGLVSAAGSAGSAAGPLLLWMAAPWIGWPAQLLVFLACGYALLMLAFSGRRSALLLAAVLGLHGAAFAASGPGVRDYFPGSDPAHASDFDATVLPFVRPGLGSTVVVSRDTRLGTEMLWIDRGLQGHTTPLGLLIPERLGSLPCRLLDRPPRRALVIGLGMGLTLRGVVDAGAREVDVAELSRGVIEANRSILAPSNGHVLDRNGVRVHLADGRPLLADATAPYDLILTDMIFPSVVGAGNLFSREFYALARRKLAPDGVFVHWLPCLQLAPKDFSAVAAAFLESFPEGSAWVGFLGPRRLILGLAGGAIGGGLPCEVASRRAFGPDELRALAEEVAPLRDADPRLEYRSRNERADGSFGIENLNRIAGLMKDRAWRIFAEAGLAELGGDRRRARSLYEDAALAAPGRTDAELCLQNLARELHLQDAQAAADRGAEDELLASLRRASAHPGVSEGNLHLADALVARGRIAEALTELQIAVSKSPRSADARVKRAILAHAVGDDAGARTAFVEACGLRPDRPPVYRELARRLGLAGD